MASPLLHKSHNHKSAVVGGVMRSDYRSKSMKGYIDVSNTAAEVGSGFNILKAPVMLSSKLWGICVEWSDEDTNEQEYQEQEARLWDILFVCGTTLEMNINSFISSMTHHFKLKG
jgi:hypothetical protein